MLNAKALSESLRVVLGEGAETVLVIGVSGDLLGSASTAPEGDAAYMEHSVLSAAATNLWAAYSNNDLSRPQQQQQAAMGDSTTLEGLEMLFTKVGRLNVCLSSVGGAAIICVAGENAPTGMLKAKAASLQRHIDGPLRSVLIR